MRKRKIIKGNEYKGKRARFTVRMPVVLYHKLIDRMDDEESLNDFIVRQLEKIARRLEHANRL